MLILEMMQVHVINYLTFDAETVTLAAQFRCRGVLGFLSLLSNLGSQVCYKIYAVLRFPRHDDRYAVAQSDMTPMQKICNSR